MTNKKISVLLGGNSKEREISLQSGKAVISALEFNGLRPVAVDPMNKNWINELMDEQYDAAFIALHGRGGEDGSIQGLLEHLKIPYTGSGILASAIGMNKVYCKRLWIEAGFNTPSFEILYKNTSVDKIIKNFGLPIIIKPILEGSSIGIEKIDTKEQLDKLIIQQSNIELFIEQYIKGNEFTVSIFKGKALPVIQINANNNFYDYKAKYEDNTTEYIFDTCLNTKQTKEIQQLALDAFNHIGAKTWGRIDILQDLTGRFWLLEINTIPGMTKQSLLPKAAAYAGIDFNQLILEVIKDSLNN